MELDCFTCDQPIPIDLLDWERLSVECPSCKNWNAYSPPYVEALSHINDAYFLNEHYINFLRRLIINRTPNQVTIEIPSHRILTATERVSNSVGKALSVFLVLTSVVTVISAERWAATEFAGVIITFVILAGLLGFFLGIFMLRSDATYVVKLDNTTLEQYLQFPLGFKTKRHSKNILRCKQFYVREIAKRGERGSYRLLGIDRRSGNREEILKGSEALMLLVESELEKLLNIIDSPVSGALANPYQKTVSADMIPRWVTGLRIHESERVLQGGEDPIPISIADHIHLEDKAFHLTYADEAFIDYVRRIKVQHSDDLCLVESSPNWFVYRGFRVLRGLMGLLALLVSAVYFID